MRILIRFRFAGFFASAAILTMPVVAATIPARPQLPPPAALVHADLAMCETPGLDDATVEKRLSEQMAAIKTADQANDAANTALVEWKIDRIIAARRWAAADRSKFARRMLSDPTIANGVRAKSSSFQAMMQAINALTAAQKRGDTKAACLHGGEMVRLVAAMASRNVSDWVITQQRYDAEAARLGVSLKAN